MKTETRTVYIANDGIEFEDEDECIKYEKSIGFQAYLTQLIYESTDLRECEAEQVAGVISDRFISLCIKYNSLQEIE